jgi:diguanylate cyclase (GGDEF)-like protein/putative nucleotidyltransferase with HDIG domain
MIAGSTRRAEEKAEGLPGVAPAATNVAETIPAIDTSRPKQLPLFALLYIGAMSLIACYFLRNAFQVWQPEWRLSLLLYVAVAVASSGMKVRPPGVTGNISVSYVFVLFGLLEFQLAETLAFAVLGAVTQTFWQARNNKIAHLVFNSACIVVTVSASAFTLSLPILLDWREGAFLRLILAGTVYFVTNTLAVSIMIAIAERHRLQKVWQQFYNWLFSYYLVGVSLAEMVHLSMIQLGWTFAAALLPMLYLIFRSYRLYFSKLQQERSHAENIASLHVRTIEALAMAIEAKDECTHEHLRRVQVYSLAVASHLNLDKDQMQALHAASILHDIGKLAVPDYIISKPGKLTPEEFEKMKIHTVVGAAILEQVGFPAVPPIVRSHHERWDGAGYPDGLRGEEIPIGARILTAVDCLDALATDRQYRRALPLDEAMSYIANLAGIQFDPRVVEVLQANYLEFEAATRATPLRATKLDRNFIVSRGDAPAAGFEKLGGATAPPIPPSATFLDSIVSARQEVQTMLEITHDLSGSLRLEEVLSVVAQRLRQLVPFDCIAVYILEGTVLRPKYVNGESSRLFASLAIPVGEGLSGWVVENQMPIVNGNPSVEPGYVSDTSKFRLLNALSVPLGERTDEVRGALTLYNAERDSYTRDHLHVLLAVTPRISRAIDSALRLEHAQREASTDELTTLPNARALYLHLQSELVKAKTEAGCFALLVCDLDGFKNINDGFGHLTGNELLKRVALILQNNCREADFVAGMGGEEFVLMFAGARRGELESRIDNLDRLIRRACYDLCGDDGVGLSVGIACYPEDGSDPDTLLSHSDREMYHAKRTRKASEELLKVSQRVGHRALTRPVSPSAESPFCQLLPVNSDIACMPLTDTAGIPVAVDNTSRFRTEERIA